MKNRSGLARPLEPFVSSDALTTDTSLDEAARGPSSSRPTRDRRVAVIRRALIVADFVALTLAAFVGAVVAHHGAVDVSYGEVLAYCAILGTWLPVAKLHGLYAKDVRRLDHSTFDDLGPIFHAVTSTSWLGVLVVSVVRPDHWSLITGFTIWLGGLVALPVGRAIARSVARRSTSFVQNAVIVGAVDVQGGPRPGRRLRP